jgi:hypothetical protein
MRGVCALNREALGAFTPAGDELVSAPGDTPIQFDMEMPVHAPPVNVEEAEPTPLPRKEVPRRELQTSREHPRSAAEGREGQTVVVGPEAVRVERHNGVQVGTAGAAVFAAKAGKAISTVSKARAPPPRSVSTVPASRMPLRKGGVKLQGKKRNE